MTRDGRGYFPATAILTCSDAGFATAACEGWAAELRREKLRVRFAKDLKSVKADVVFLNPVTDILPPSMPRGEMQRKLTDYARANGSVVAVCSPGRNPYRLDASFYDNKLDLNLEACDGPPMIRVNYAFQRPAPAPIEFYADRDGELVALAARRPTNQLAN